MVPSLFIAKYNIRSRKFDRYKLAGYLYSTHNNSFMLIDSHTKSYSYVKVQSKVSKVKNANGGYRSTKPASGSFQWGNTGGQK
jgi:hypothetical protein